MIDGTRFALFVSAAAILALTPGPGILYVLGRTLHGGRREGVLSALGTFVGGSVHVLAAGLGLSAILMTSATAFQVVRYAGAAYLVYLGISMIRKRRASGNTNCRTEFSTKLFAGHCNRGSQSKNSALLSIVYSAVRFTCQGALDFTISDSWHNFSCPEYDRGPCRGRIRWFNRTKTCPESQTHRETTHRVGCWNDRARCLRRGLEMSIRP